MRKAFTLIELIVAMGILAVVLSFAGVIFRVSIESHRMAMANAEIMQKLRAITGQLDTDLKSMIFDYGGQVMARQRTYTLEGQDGADDKEITINSDSVVFFAQGDFQSTGQYDVDGTEVTIAGNVAVLYYGPPDPNSYDREPEPWDRLLLRRQTILASEAPDEDSDPNGEYYATSLEQWRTGTPRSDRDSWIRAPLIDLGDLKTNLPMYLTKGVDGFTVSYLERGDTIGIDALEWKRHVAGEDEDKTSGINPYVFKFTFTLYDSRGIIKNGRLFTHIVYLGK